MSEIAFCERTGYGVVPPPPNRVLDDRRILGGSETPASKRLRSHWERLRRCWPDLDVEQRRAEIARYQAHYDEVHGVTT